MDLEGDIVLKDDASRFETGTVDAAAYVGLRQALAVHRALGTAVGDRLRALRALLERRLAELPFDLLSRPEDPTGIVVAAPRGASPADVVDRMWKEHQVVVKLLAEPGLDAVRISFWALHREEDIDRVAAGFAHTLAGAIAVNRS
jgi:selenocysteine lyase/cysteine desulfurase